MNSYIKIFFLRFRYQLRLDANAQRVLYVPLRSSHVFLQSNLLLIHLRYLTHLLHLYTMALSHHLVVIYLLVWEEVMDLKDRAHLDKPAQLSVREPPAFSCSLSLFLRRP